MLRRRRCNAGPQYIHDNTEDEFTHFNFINAYLMSKGAEPVNLDRFRTLKGSTAPGAQDKKRLTNLMELTVDTSWWTRYRSRTQNPDFGDKFAPAIPGLLKGKFPAIPRSDKDLTPPEHLRAIVNILLSIGPTETMHFQVWHDKAGNIQPVTDPTNGLEFPDLAMFDGNEDLQANLIMPEPTVFLSRSFRVCSIIRPTETRGAAAGRSRPSRPMACSMASRARSSSS